MVKRIDNAGLAVKLQRVQAGLLQYEVAAALGISPQRLSLIENGRLMVSPLLMDAIISLIESWPDDAGAPTEAA